VIRGSGSKEACHRLCFVIARCGLVGRQSKIDNCDGGVFMVLTRNNDYLPLVVCQANQMARIATRVAEMPKKI
jgi:hypothetical protein